jgi:hypothetical protein
MLPARLAVLPRRELGNGDLTWDYIMSSKKKLLILHSMADNAKRRVFYKSRFGSRSTLNLFTIDSSSIEGLVAPLKPMTGDCDERSDEVGFDGGDA